MLCFVLDHKLSNNNMRTGLARPQPSSRSPHIKLDTATASLTRTRRIQLR